MRLYLDLDDVVFDTTRYLEELLGWTKGSKGTVYDSFVESNDLCSMSSMLEYTKIPLKLTISQIDLLKDMFEVVICTEYYTTREIQQKKQVVQDLFGISQIIGVDRNKTRKYLIDFGENILVDDTLDIIRRCNAKHKIWVSEKEILEVGISVVKDFNGLYKELERIRGA